MPIIGTFNGANIVQLPSSPVPRSLDFTAHDTVAVSTSPFSGQQQIQDWQASWLEASVSLPPLTHKQAQTWIAFLLQLRGQSCLFQMGDPLGKVPSGSLNTVGGVSTDGQQSGYSLKTKGWTPNAASVLLPGDWIQIGYRLYRNLDVVNVDADGKATLNIWPQIREQGSGSLNFSNTKGLWRLKSNDRKWSANEAKIYGLQFDIREAL